MQIEKKIEENVTVLALGKAFSGSEDDGALRGAISEAFESGSENVLVDFGRELMHPQVITYLVEIVKTFNSSALKLKLCNAQPEILSMLIDTLDDGEDVIHHARQEGIDSFK